MNAINPEAEEISLEDLEAAEAFYNRITGRPPARTRARFLDEATRDYKAHHGTDLAGFYFQEYTFGYSAHLEIKRRDLGGYTRNELWYSRNEEEKPVFEYTFCHGPDDHSPRQSREEYDPNCSCCWLGISHTKRLHAARAET